MAGLRGLEPRTLGLEVRCSIHWLQARQNLPETWATGSPFPETLSKALHFAPSSLLRRHGVQKSKCRFWCRLRGNPPLISPLNWTEDGLTSVPRATQDTRSAGRVSAWHTPLTRRSRTFDRVRKHYCVKE